MYKELKALFGGKKPSVRKFNLALRALSLEEQNRYYKADYDTAFTKWDTLPQSYQTFLRDLLMHDKQRTADYLRRINGRLTLFAALFLAILATVPTVFTVGLQTQIPFAASSILIAVSVVLETKRQLDDLLVSRNYDSIS